MQQQGIDPQELRTVLDLLEEGEMGLTAACERLHISLSQLATIVYDAKIELPYSMEDYEQDKKLFIEGLPLGAETHAL